MCLHSKENTIGIYRGIYQGGGGGNLKITYKLQAKFPLEMANLRPKGPMTKILLLWFFLAKV